MDPIQNKCVFTNTVQLNHHTLKKKAFDTDTSDIQHSLCNTVGRSWSNDYESCWEGLIHAPKKCKQKDVICYESASCSRIKWWLTLSGITLNNYQYFQTVVVICRDVELHCIIVVFFAVYC